MIEILIFYLFIGANRYAADFEELGASVRVRGMGNVGVTGAADASYLYYNPSSTSFAENSLTLLHSEHFGLVSANFLAGSIKTDFGGVGLGIYRVGVGSIFLTELPDTTQPPSDTNLPYVRDTVSVNDWIGYLNLSRRFGNLGIGGNLKVIYRDLAEATGFGVGIDGGIRYLPYQWVTFGICVKNLSSSPLFWSTDSVEFMIPRAHGGITLSFRFGDQILNIGGEAIFEFDLMQSVGRVGFEYNYNNALFLRGGLKESGLSFGAGFFYKKIFLDYAFYPHPDIDKSHLVSGGIRF